MAKRGRKKAAAKSEKAIELANAAETNAAAKQRGRKSPYDAETKAAILRGAAHSNTVAWNPALSRNITN